MERFIMNYEDERMNSIILIGQLNNHEIEEMYKVHVNVYRRII